MISDKCLQWDLKEFGYFSAHLMFDSRIVGQLHLSTLSHWSATLEPSARQLVVKKK